MVATVLYHVDQVVAVATCEYWFLSMTPNVTYFPLLVLLSPVTDRLISDLSLIYGVRGDGSGEFFWGIHRVPNIGITEMVV